MTSDTYLTQVMTEKWMDRLVNDVYHKSIEPVVTSKAFPNIDIGVKTIRIKGFTSVIIVDFQGNSEVHSDSNITLSILYYSCFLNWILSNTIS